MINHVSINVSDFDKSKTFYSEALKPLGYELLMDFKEYNVAGFGAHGKADLWIHGGKFLQPSHVAIAAESKAAIDNFYNAALAAGGKDNGKPEYQQEYSPDYYAAFVFDLDGNNIEAVIHQKP